jgi:hypothetical protein
MESTLRGLTRNRNVKRRWCMGRAKHAQLGAGRGLRRADLDELLLPSRKSLMAGPRPIFVVALTRPSTS